MRRIRLLAVVAGAFPSLDTSVNVAFPDIDDHFGLDVADLQWIVITYLFTYGGLLVGAGRLGDRLGHRRLVSIGGWVSVLALAGCAAASSFGLFLVARVVQGVGTALVLAGAPALLTTTAADRDGRSTAVGWFQAAAMLGLAFGPIVGGPLVELWGWRAVYVFRIPIAVAIVVLASSAVGSSRDAAASPTPSSGLRTLWRRRPIRRVAIATAAGNAAMFPTWLLVPSLLVDEIAVSEIAAGLALAASPALSAVGSVAATRATRRSSPHVVAAAGLIVMAVGLVTIAIAGPSAAVDAVVLGLVAVGLGLGLFSVPTMDVVMAELPLDQQGLAGGVSLAARTLGVVIGVFVAGSAFDAIETGSTFDRAFVWIFLGAAGLAVATAVLLRPRP